MCGAVCLRVVLNGWFLQALCPGGATEDCVTFSQKPFATEARRVPPRTPVRLGPEVWTTPIIRRHDPVVDQNAESLVREWADPQAVWSLLSVKIASDLDILGLPAADEII